MQKRERREAGDPGQGIAEGVSTAARAVWDEDVLRSAQAVMTAAPHAAIIIDRDGAILAISPAFAAHFGLTPAELTGRDCFSLVSDQLAEKRRAQIEAALASESVVRWEEEFDGAVHAVALLPIRTSPDSKPTIVLVVASDITARRRAERLLREQNAQLAAQTQRLEEANIALKVLLERQERDRRELESDILNNIRLVIRPMLERLKSSAVDRRQADLVQQLEHSLRTITSPFLSRLSVTYSEFTPREIEVANLIREGRSSKEIATMLGASETTVKFHRQNVRKKLHLAKEKVNLRAYLMSLDRG